LVIEVFSRDQVPVHILTKEAFEIYLKHLDANGVIAIHISNRFLNLVLPLKAVQEHFGLYARLVDRPKKGLAAASTWVLLSRNERIIERMSSTELDSRPVRLWTDDYSNLFYVLKR